MRSNYVGATFYKEEKESLAGRGEGFVQRRRSRGLAEASLVGSTPPIVILWKPPENTTTIKTMTYSIDTLSTKRHEWCAYRYNAYSSILSPLLQARATATASIPTQDELRIEHSCYPFSE